MVIGSKNPHLSQLQGALISSNLLTSRTIKATAKLFQYLQAPDAFSNEITEKQR
jgi:hypothetical protein